MKCESWIYFAQTTLFFIQSCFLRRLWGLFNYHTTFKNQNFPKPLFIVCSLWLNLFWANILFRVNLSWSVLLMQLFDSAKEDVMKSFLPLLPDQGCFNGNMVLLIWFIWEFFLCSLYLAENLTICLLLLGKKRLSPCQHNYIGELGNNEWEQMKYLDINSLFSCAVIVANKAGMCGLWFRDRMRNQDIWIPFLALPQWIEKVIKSLCAPSVGSG